MAAPPPSLPARGCLVCAAQLIRLSNFTQDELEDLGEDSYVLFDCPGQIELYSHVPAMRHLIDALQRMRFRVCALYLLDAQFVADVSKFVSGVLCCLSVIKP